ncbi:alpha/beta hydrolase, partial [Clostridium chrysemydis]
VINYKGIDLLVKNIPEDSNAGDMDQRLYNDSKKQMKIMSFMPKKMMEFDSSKKSIEKLRKMFNEIKSRPIVNNKIIINNDKFKSFDGTYINLRIYKREDYKENSQILYYIHGGGFFGGSLDVVEELIKVIVDNTNIIAVSVDYRLAPENKYPTGHKDCFCGLEWVYNNCLKLGGNKDNIFVCGDSAGGNLAHYCSLKDRELNKGMVKGQLLLYPTLNMAKFEDDLFKWSIDEYEISPKYKKGIETMLYMFDNLSLGLSDILGVDADKDNHYLNPYSGDVKGLPKTFITVGEHDYLKVESLAYAVKLNREGIYTKTILYKGLGHAYGDNIGYYPQSEDCAIEIGKFILENSK